MPVQTAFKRPTIKGTNRAYVRLFEFFADTETWLNFLERYRVEYMAFGTHRDGDCAICVIDPINGERAILGLDIPNVIKYHNHTSTGRSFWTEEFESTTQRRKRIFEIGYSQATKDDVCIR